MDRVFKSKVDWWYHLMIFILAVLCLLAAINFNWPAIALSFLSAVFVIHTLFNTDYTITADGVLKLRFGIFPRKEIPINEIEALERSLMPVFSYALSLNRLVIWKEGKMWMLISPQNEKEFIQQLKKHNPDINLIKESDLLL